MKLVNAVISADIHARALVHMSRNVPNSCISSLDFLTETERMRGGYKTNDQNLRTSISSGSKKLVVWDIVKI